MQAPQTDASLRGLSAVNETVVFASGTKGTVVRTADGGANWELGPIPGAEDLDFRDIEAVDGKTVYLMSAGTGRLSRVYKSVDGGRQWTGVLNNPDAQGFFDSIAFWDRDRGLLIGDPVDGRFILLRTLDGGDSWQRITLPANPGEGAFAASGTSVVVRPGGHAWFVTGGTGGGRVFRSIDYGLTWKVVQTPIRHDDAAAGIFSVAFRDDLHGIVVGGVYNKLDEDRDNISITSDGGKTWVIPAGPRPRGFRSSVVFLPGGDALATGPGGTDVSTDGGRTWHEFSAEGFHSLSSAGWASGAKGRIASLYPTPKSGSGTGALP